LNCQGAIDRLYRFTVAVQDGIAKSELLQNVVIAWVQLRGTLIILDAFLVLAPASHDCCGQIENPRIVRQGAPRHLQLSQGSIVIAICLIQMTCARQMRLAGVRSKSKGGGNGSLGRGEPGRRMFSAEVIE